MFVLKASYFSPSILVASTRERKGGDDKLERWVNCLQELCTSKQLQNVYLFFFSQIEVNIQKFHWIHETYIQGFPFKEW